jgi:hypothetical protein
MKFKTFIYYKNLLEFSEVTTGRQKCRHDDTVSPCCLCYQKIRRKDREQQRVRENYNLIWDVTLILLPEWKKNSAVGRGGGEPDLTLTSPGKAEKYCR